MSFHRIHVHGIGAIERDHFGSRPFNTYEVRCTTRVGDLFTAVLYPSLFVKGHVRVLELRDTFPFHFGDARIFMPSF